MTAIQRDPVGSSSGQPLIVDRRVDSDVDVAMITFNRPEKRNPIDKETIALLRDVLVELDGENGPAVLILTGAGDTFSAGGDLKGYQSLYRDGPAFRRFMQDFEEVCRILESTAALTVAMINGTCVAGGLELSLACDLITMSETALVGDGHLRFAQLPGAGGSQRLVRAIGVQRAKQWLYTGEMFPAAAALEAGLVYQCAPPEELLSVTLGIASQVARHTRLGMRRMKELVRLAQQTSLDEGLLQEQQIVYGYATTSHDAMEGLRAFADRRPARYLGR
jgi:enoyl-CoA hydratase/carnithine racemase